VFGNIRLPDAQRADELADRAFPAAASAPAAACEQLDDPASPGLGDRAEDVEGYGDPGHA
jgi:hypothetical protein